MTLNLAILGVGWAGTRHIEAINELAGWSRRSGKESPIRVAMIIDPDEAHLVEVKERFGIPHASSRLESALDDQSIDAVSIATPHSLHAEAAVRTAQARKHIAVEKPIAVTVDEADEMIEAADRASVKLFVTEQVAYSEEVRKLREIVGSDELIGELTFVSVTAGFRADDYGYPGRRSWLAQPDAGGSGTWLLHGVHTVAAIRAVFGEVQSIFCQESKSPSFDRSDIEGTMSCLLRMESGISLHLTQSCETAYAADRSGTTVFGTHGTLFSGKDGITVQLRSESDKRNIEVEQTGLSDYAEEFRAFADWISHGNEPPTTGRHERGSLAVIQAGYESADSGLPVDLRERFGDPPEVR